MNTQAFTSVAPEKMNPTPARLVTEAPIEPLPFEDDIKRQIEIKTKLR